MSFQHRLNERYEIKEIPVSNETRKSIPAADGKLARPFSSQKINLEPNEEYGRYKRGVGRQQRVL